MRLRFGMGWSCTITVRNRCASGCDITVRNRAKGATARLRRGTDARLGVISRCGTRGLRVMILRGCVFFMLSVSNRKDAL